jgi:pimeloyl-ACP methyl ester carboxylesterase
VTTASLPALSEKGSVRLRDGRRLSFSISGVGGGYPVLYLHGAIGAPARHERELERLIIERRLRFIALDRPGYGGSDRCEGRTVACFARDVEDLADDLGLARFSIVGVSAGAPYALAGAWALPSRVAAAAAVSSVTPGLIPLRTAGMRLRYRLGLTALLRAPGSISRLGDLALEQLARRPAMIGAVIRAGASDGDADALREPGALQAAVRRFLAASEPGVAPLIEDYLISARPWGFEPASIKAPTHLWHGEVDRLVPVRHALSLGRSIEGCRISLDPGGGHFFFRKRLQDVIEPLIERRSDRARSPLRRVA